MSHKNIRYPNDFIKLAPYYYLYLTEQFDINVGRKDLFYREIENGLHKKQKRIFSSIASRS